MAAAECKSSLDLLPEDLSLSCFGEEKLTQRSKRQGYRFFVQGYLHKLSVSEHHGDVVAKAKCFRSMRKNEAPHALNVCFDAATKLISLSSCNCKAGVSGHCSHIVGLVQALMHYRQWGMKEIPTEMSCTQLQQRWGKPRGNKIKAGSVMSLVCAKAKPDGKMSSRPVTATLTKQRVLPATAESIGHLTALKGTPLAYLLTPRLPVEHTAVGPVQAGSPLPYHVDKYEDRTLPSDVLPCGHTSFPLELDAGSYPVLPPLYMDCNYVCPLTFDEARKLEGETIKQASSDAWFKARENRLTASCFHTIDKRVRDFDDKFVLSVLSSPKSVSSTPCSYGRAHESVAKMRYCELNPSVHFNDCGFVVNPHFSFLGATPDAKVCCKGVTGILEVKCPYTARDKVRQWHK